MRSKILPIILSAVVFSSCSTAYRSGQTPDDVYYSPARVQKEDDDREEKREQARNSNAVDYEITMGIRDRRWRDFREDYEYQNSPYKFTVSNCTNGGYYYNPYYYPWAIYTTTVVPVNTTPRMVNLNAYKGYNARVASGKTSGTVTWANPVQYNNSNRSSAPSEGRRVILPSRSTESSSNNTRTYSPSSNNSRNSSNSSSNNNSGSSSSGSSSSGSVSRPGRGG